MSLRDKLKIKGDLAKKLETDSGNRDNDNRILNYFDLEFGEKIKLMILPDPNGEVWVKFHHHGGRVKGAGRIGCSHKNNGVECAVCQEGHRLWGIHTETGLEADKNIAVKFFSDDSTIMNVIVLESDIDIRESEDGNEAKIMYVPRAIETMIREAIKEGQITQDELPFIPLVLKKTKNAGGRPAYDNSYFDFRNPVNDDTLDALSESIVEPFDLTTIDLLPEEPSIEEQEKFIEKLTSMVTKKSGASKGAKSHDEDEEEAPTKRQSLSDKLKAKTKAKKTEPAYESDDESDDESDYDDEPDYEEEAPEEEEAPAKRQSLSERLKKVKAK